MNPNDLRTEPAEPPPPPTVPVAQRGTAVAAPPTRRRRRWPLLLGCVLVLVAIPLGYYFYLTWVAASDLQAAIDEADRLDPHWRLKDILADQKPIPDEENSALVVMKVDEMVRPGGYDIGQKNWRLFEQAAPVHRLNGPQIVALREALTKHAEAVKVARTLKEFRGEGRFPIKQSPDWISTTLEPLQRCRGVMSLLQHDAMLRAEDGDMAGAMESCRALLSTARAIGVEPILIAALIRYAGEGITVATLERVLAQGVPPADELRAIQELLSKEIDAPLLLEGMRGERGGGEQLLDMLEKGDMKLSTLTGMIGGPGGANASWEDWLFQLFPGVMRVGRADHLRLVNEAVEATKLPLEKQGEALKQVEDKAKASRSLVTRLLMPATAKVALAHRRSRAMLRCAEVGVAAERYRLEHGRWPESIDSLVKGGLLSAVPLDPFDGQRLRFKRTNDGVIVYSVGIDLVDNDGNLNRDNPHQPGSDIGFQLWDPDARQQAPLPPPPPEE
jgi:hypothetical protein